MEEERTALVGPRSKPNAERTAVRHGYEDGAVTLGGRRRAVRRPRARSADGSAELPLRTYERFADRDPLSRAVLERMLAGVSCRRDGRTQEPVGELALARRPPLPGVEALAGDTDDTAQQGEGELCGLGLDEPEPRHGRSVSLAKKAAARFRISRS